MDEEVGNVTLEAEFRAYVISRSNMLASFAQIEDVYIAPPENLEKGFHFPCAEITLRLKLDASHRYSMILLGYSDHILSTVYSNDDFSGCVVAVTIDSFEGREEADQCADDFGVDQWIACQRDMYARHEKGDKV